MTGLSRRGLIAAAGALGAGAVGLARSTTAHADEEAVVAGRRRLVSTPAELGAAYAWAEPGDVIMMKNGTWRDVGIEFRAMGTAERPITLRAQTPGGVIISGSSYLRILGDHLVVDGLTFRDGAAPDDRYHLIQFSDWLNSDPFDGGTFSNHCRLTNVMIDGFNQAAAGSALWVGLWGHHNRIDHCSFVNKAKNGLVIVAWRPFGDPDHHQIDHNYFADMPSSGPGGMVLVRIGDGNQATKASHSVIEHNLFERITGIGNIINLKCSDTIVRDNTFRQATGAINLRAGHRNVIERNFILPPIPDLNNDYFGGGVNVIGEDHVIRGNYFQDCSTRFKNGIGLYQGDAENAPGKGSYYPTKNVLIENNTLVDNYTNFRVGVIGGGSFPEGDIDIPVENIIYCGNAVVGNESPEPVMSIINPPIGDIVYERNMFFGGNLEGLTDTPGIEIADPGLVEQPDGTYQYRPDSPLRGNITTRPLTKGQVGPAWDWR
ncbi:polysaccharide lyase 6 family protein [Microlunatus sp. Y2014]|uniref:polysaccharide lyase 6 family protein n=1 Tax=Microlunatus sp. Y2014 TaxID=3418488 RepID=UPI003DA711D2